ncbi:NAD(P)H-binding protein [Rhodopila sp.]|uniref:NmrA family NAD(P)-binding protein n=1 Tax=Rhodopila sp. TaxID=2480087 RepID=UPI003D13878A
MIVITTPTGQIGRHVVRHCLDHEEPIRVIARDPSHLPGAIRDRVQVVRGSHGDASVVDEALAGADALFWLVPPDPKTKSVEAAYLDFTRPACEAIRRHGVARVVDVKALAGGTRWAEHAGLASVSQRMDELIAAMGVALRSLAAPAFMDNMLMQRQSILEKGTFFGPIDADRSMPQIATRDIGAVAARLLSDRSWSNQADVPLLGPEDLSFNDMAAIMTEVLGTPIRYQQVPFNAFEAQLGDRGMSASFVRGFVDMMRAKNEGLDNAQPRTADATTPTTFRQWCEQALTTAAEK